MTNQPFGALSNPLIVDSSNPLPVTLSPSVSNTNPLPVTIVDAASTGTAQLGGKRITTTGTSVRLTATPYILQNGITITAGVSNTAFNTTSGSTGGVFAFGAGSSAVTNATDATGIGVPLQAGATLSIPSGVDISTVYFNGILGDTYFWAGN